MICMKISRIAVIVKKNITDKKVSSWAKCILVMHDPQSYIC